MALAGRIALITGASRGIGEAIARRLAADGARVVAAARSEDAIGALVRELGDGHVAAPMDVADPASIAAALPRIAEIGRVDLLVCNAGIAESAPYHKSDDEAFLRMMSVNALSVLRLCRALVPAMSVAGWGRVVVVASNAALTGYAYSSSYCASKHAALGLVRAIALEVAKSGVTVNAVCPGWVDTDMAATAVARIARSTGRSEEQARAALAGMSPQGRMVSADEVANLVAFLCDERAGGIHGQALALDGGQLL